MRHRGVSSLLAVLLFATWHLPAVATLPSRSAKRGLVYVSTAHSQADDAIWTQPKSDLTWYYNYSPYINSDYPSLEFVPMLFSIPDDGDTTFLDQVTPLLTSNNNNKPTTHILSFNEPDGPTSQGGTALSPASAAKSYLSILSPLLKTHPNLSLGLPAVTGSPRGLTWLADFNGSCHRLAPSTGCPASFIPVHWYGSFDGFASYIAQIRALYPRLPIWVTEFADTDAEGDLQGTQAFFNQSVAYLDKLAYVERYAYFGSFRSQDSNVGADAAMLDQGGALTEVGVWYLGVNGTGKDPSSGVGRVGAGAWQDGMVGGWLFVGFVVWILLDF